jgi:hypothetical protein
MDQLLWEELISQNLYYLLVDGKHGINPRLSTLFPFRSLSSNPDQPNQIPLWQLNTQIKPNVSTDL